MAENYGLRKIRIGGRHVSQSQWQEVLVTTEYLGQLRAVGSNLLSSEYAPLATRRRLLSLSAKVIESYSIVEADDAADGSQRKAIETLNRLIRVDLQQDYPTVEAEYYFSLCTELMDGLFERYDQLMDQVS